MAIIGELIVKLTAQDADLKKSLGTAQKSLEDFGTKAKTIGKNLSLFVTAPILGLGAASLKAASDAEETSSKFSVVFGNIEDSANSVADNLVKNFGLSSKASKQLLSDTGDLLTGFGFSQEAALGLSKQVNELAVDLASFTNFSGGAEGASQALTKALLGERESIKSLGIAILDADIEQLAKDKGIVGELDRQTKAALTLELAIKQSKNAIGDFSKTQDSFSNQSRIAKARLDDLAVSMGEQLLPIATEVLGGVIGIVKAFGSLDDGTKKIIIGLAGLAAVIGPVTAAVGGLATAFAFLAANPVVALIGVLGLAAAALGTYIYKQSEAKKGTVELKDSTADLNKELTETEKITQRINDPLGTATENVKKFNKSIETLTNEQRIKAYTNKIIELQKELDKANKFSFGLGGDVSIRNEIQRLQTLLDIEKSFQKDKKEVVKKTEEEIKQIQEEKDQELQDRNSEAVELFLANEEEKRRIVEDSYKLINDKNDEAVELFLANEEEKRKSLEETEKKEKEITEFTLNSFKNLGNVISEVLRTIVANNKSATDSMIDDINKRYEIQEEQIKNEVENTEEANNLIKELEKSKNDEITKIKKESEEKAKGFIIAEAIATRSLAIFDIALKTQQAVMSALTIPPPVGPILAGVNLAAGIAAGATVAAQPLPEFATGGLVTTATRGIVGEAGAEAILPLTDSSAMDSIGEAISRAIGRSRGLNNIDNRPIIIGLNIDGQALNATITENIDNRKILVNSNAIVQGA